MRGARVLIVLAGAVSALRADFVGRPLVAVYSSAEVGEDAMSWTVAPGADGLLHFGGNRLFTFDGLRWRSDPAGSAYAIRGLDFAPDGRLFAAATGDLGWFARERSGAWAFHSLLDRLPADERDVGELWNVFTVPGGAVFAGAHAIYAWNGRGFSIRRYGGRRRILLLRADGRLFIDAPEEGLIGWSDAARPIVPAAALAGGAVFWMERRGGGWLLGTSRGFFLVSGAAVSPIWPEASARLRSGGLVQILRLPDGRLAVATLRSGVILLAVNGRVEEVLGRAQGLPTDELFGLGLDRESGLWAVSGANIFRLSLRPGSRWYVSDERTGDEPCIALTESAGERVLATDTRLFLADAAKDRYTTLPGWRRHPFSLLPDSEGVLVCDNEGLSRIRGGQVVTVVAAGTHVFAAAPGPEPNVLLASTSDGILRVDLARGTEGPAVVGLPETATTLAFAAGRLWLGTCAHGLWTAPLSPTGGPPAIARPTEELGPAQGWAHVAGWPGGPVFVFWNRRAWTGGPDGRLRPVENFPAREVAALEAQKDGSAWAVLPAEGDLGPCLGEATGFKAGASWFPRLIEGLERVGLPQCVHLEDQGGGPRVWIGGSEGLVQANFEHRGGPAPLPRPRVALHAPGLAVGAPGGFRVPFADASIALEASVTSYAFQPLLKVETRVEGIDRGWVPLDAGGIRVLAALREGAYVVRARTMAATGETSGETRQGFVVLPPWWRTLQARSLAASLLAAAVFGLHRLRLAALRRRAAALEKTVRRRTQDLQRAQEEKARLLAGISHDIRNPLNGIVGMSFALEDSRLERAQREIVRGMRDCARYLDRLLEDVIEFARLETAGPELRAERCRPVEILRDVAAIVGPEASATGSSLKIDCAPDVPDEIWADGLRLRQILANFAFNAVRHAGGAIGLGASPCGGGCVDFHVEDRGAGLPERIRERAFEPFVRGERGAGTGLGLSTSKGWAEAMGGSVRVESPPAGGSRFVLCLPIGIAPIAPPDAAQTALQSRALIVEDDDYNAWACAAVLARLGIVQVERARDGAEAIAAARRAPPDLILIDRGLPDGDGLKLCGRLGGASADKPTLVIMSAGLDPADERRCEEAGADAVVQKPLTPDVLRTLLASAGARVDLGLLRYLADGTEGAFEREKSRYLAAVSADRAELARAVHRADRCGSASAAHRLAGHFRMIDAAAAAAAALEAERAALADAPGWRAACAAAGRAAGSVSQAVKRSAARNPDGAHNGPARGSYPNPACASD